MNTLTTITETNPCFLCCFCKSGLVDDLKLGQLFMYDGVVTHYFCMLFSAALSQNGRDDEGILGFLPNDIMTEVRRSFRLRCTYCGNVGASVGCCNKRCRTAFHFPCGLTNGANYQFFGNYESYCAEHVKLKEIRLPMREWYCPICTSKVPTRPEGIQSSCCKSAVFHKECLQKLALSSGYFFKCPLCNNGKEFVHEMRSLGIFVPEQDASWEREPNAYEDLYYQHSQCDTENCVCPKGRSYSGQKGSWMLARCRICGASGTHKQCSNLTTIENWACETCLAVELRTEKEKETKQQALMKDGNQVEPMTSRSGDGEDAGQEAYVSARSGNRKVRNGRLQKRTAGKKHWRFSDLEISPWCFWYFPYNKQHLSYFNSTSTLPDWRNLTLRVNLVNWIPKSIFHGPCDSDDDGAALPKVTIEGITEEDRALISDSEIVTGPDITPRRTKTKLTKTFKIKAKKRKSTRKTNWATGRIRKGKSRQRYLLEWRKRKATSTDSESGHGGSSQAGELPSPVDIDSPGKWEVKNPEKIIAATVCRFVRADSDSMSLLTTNDSTQQPSSEELMDVVAEDEFLPVISSEEFDIDIQDSIEIPADGVEGQGRYSDEVPLPVSEAVVDVPDGVIVGWINSSSNEELQTVCIPSAKDNDTITHETDRGTEAQSGTRECESTEHSEAASLKGSLLGQCLSPRALSLFMAPNQPNPDLVTGEDGPNKPDAWYQVRVDHPYCKPSPDENKNVVSLSLLGTISNSSCS